VLDWGESGIGGYNSPNFLTGLAAVFCANFPRLSKSRSLVNLFSSIIFEEIQRQTPTTQMSKQRYVSNIEARSSRLLILHLQWLGFVAVGQSLEGIQLLHRGQTLGLRSVLPSVPCCMFPVDSGAKHLFLVLTSRTHQEYNNRIDCASP
jgi:hypothetical protein